MFDFLKKKEFRNRPDELIGKLISLFEAGKKDDVVKLCNDYREDVKNNFKAWAKIPDHIRATPSRIDVYAKTLIYIASTYGYSGDDSLLKILQGDKSNNPVEVFQNNILQAMKLSESGKFEESRNILLSVIPDIDKSVGNARASLLPKAFGHLGLVSLRLGDMAGAIQNSHKALSLCRESADLEGVVTYAGNLIGLMNKSGVQEKDLGLVKERIAALKQLGRTNEASEFEKKYDA
jgi:hypothetical protein